MNNCKRLKKHIRISGLILAATMLLCAVYGCGATDENSEAESSSTLHSNSAGRSVASAPKVDTTEIQTMMDMAEPEQLDASAEDVPTIAVTPSSAPIYTKPEVSEIKAYSTAGQEFNYRETGSFMWYEVETDGITDGYIYGECLYDVTDGKAAEFSLVDEFLNTKIEFLQSTLPEGKYWNHAGQELAWGEESPFIVSDTPCDHSSYGYVYCNFYNGTTANIFGYDNLCQCLGFASLLSDQLFTKAAPLHIFYDPDMLRLGDHIRLGEYEHSMTIVAINDEYLTLGESNQNYEDCRISWTRRLAWDELYELDWDAEYISRYPLCPDGSGGFEEWEY